MIEQKGLRAKYEDLEGQVRYSSFTLVCRLPSMKSMNYDISPGYYVSVHVLT